MATLRKGVGARLRIWGKKNISTSEEENTPALAVPEGGLGDSWLPQRRDGFSTIRLERSRHPGIQTHREGHLRAWRVNGWSRCLLPAPSLAPSQRSGTQGPVSGEHLKIAPGHMSYCLLQMWSSQEVCHLILGGGGGL